MTLTLGKKKCQEGLNVCMNCTAAAHEGDDNTVNMWGWRLIRSGLLGLRLLTSSRYPRSLALNTFAVNQVCVTYLAGTESYRRSISTAGPSRMALGRLAPLGDCVHY